MWPGRIFSPSSGWQAGSAPERFRISGRALLPGPIWRTVRIAAGRSPGSARTTSERACTPPAEAPITMRSWPGMDGSREGVLHGACPPPGPGSCHALDVGVGVQHLAHLGEEELRGE